MPGLTHKIRKGAHSPVVTPRMLECIDAMRTQLDAHSAAAKVGVRFAAIRSTISNVEKKTGWNLFTVTRFNQRVYAWLADPAAAPFFAWMAVHPQGGKDWPRPPTAQIRRQTHGLTLAPGRRTVQEFSRVS